MNPFAVLNYFDFHYYPYGLKIAAISSHKLPDPNEGDIKNNYLYNDKELIDDGDLNWYDYGYRNYDPQIGRFTQLDPLTWEYPYYTPYQFAGCEPVGNIDRDGLEDVGCTIVQTVGCMTATITSGTQTVITAAEVTNVVTKTALEVGTEILKTVSKPSIWEKVIFGAGQAFATVTKVASVVTLVLTPMPAGPSGNWENQLDHSPETSKKLKEQFDPQSRPVKSPNANRKDNPNEHIVYKLYGITANNEKITLKYGISDYKRYNEKRPKSQTGLDLINTILKSENPDLVGKFKKIGYDIRKYPDRLSALNAEIGYVTSYIRNNTKRSMPPIQKRPAPMSAEELFTGTEW